MLNSNPLFKSSREIHHGLDHRYTRLSIRVKTPLSRRNYLIGLGIPN
jgi:hypothetical protein